jgi:hypothetical protein
MICKGAVVAQDCVHLRTVICGSYIARRLLSFQDGNEAIGVKLETADTEMEEDPLAIVLPVMKTEQEVACVSVCPEFKEIQVCLVDYQQYISVLHAK